MDKLQLALLTAWAQDAGLPGIQGRKRMQKVIYFLQQAGCPIDAEYTLHHYGPYSREVANVTDVMVAEGLLTEQSGGSAGGQYNYTLGNQTREMLDQIGQSGSKTNFDSFREQAIELLREDLWHLELGSTILYFFRSRRRQSDWDYALREACEYKRADPSHDASKAALALAQRFASEAA
ncbi:MAG: hypothetical protein D6695_05935 [Planctomycetota bacterium]|nr:MAG: hypothetical protein D6695_05935 [Planctomycetota bacterium]